MQNYIPQTTNDAFIAMLTHDLKTPINSEIFALELLLKNSTKEFNDYQAEILKDLLSSVKFMKNLTENVLCKYKSDNGKLVLNKEFCSFKQLIKKCIEQTKYILNEKEQVIKFIAPKEDIVANVDYVEISRVINNLITNASEHSPRKSEIIMTIKHTKSTLNISVQDFGYGIPLEKLNSIFEPYMTMAKEQKTAGTGLGLYITKMIIDKHKGKINIKSKPNVGTTISFIIPKN